VLAAVMRGSAAAAKTRSVAGCPNGTAEIFGFRTGNAERVERAL
jgi:hypothetical protein